MENIAITSQVTASHFCCSVITDIIHTQVDQNGVVYDPKTDRNHCKNGVFTAVYGFNTVRFRSVSNRIIGRSNTDRIISVSQTNRILIEYAMLPCTVNRPFLQRKFSKFCYYSGRVLQSSCTEGNTFETTKYFRHIKNAHSHIMFMFAKYE